MNVWLVGMPASGKSTVGPLAAERLGLRFVDADREIERRAGRDVAGIFAEAGEEGFRSLEREVIADLARDEGVLVACGGGAVLDPANREAMRGSGTVVHLEAAGPVLVERIKASAPRPVLKDPAKIEDLRERRAEAYEAAAHAVVDATGEPGEIARRIEEAVR